MFSKHREKNYKKGGGLALGYDKKENVKLEEIETGSKDILAVEGKINNRKTRIGKKVTFKKCMDKLKKSVDHTMKKSKLQKPGGKKQTLKTAPWVDRELTDSIDLRSKYSKEWRYARKRGNIEEIKKCKEKYYQQKGVTAIMVGNKKGGKEGEEGRKEGRKEERK